MSHRVEYEFRQTRRPLKRFESIPNLCTACLLSQKVQPLLSDGPDCLNFKIRKSHERFAPWVEKIRTWRKEGRSLYWMSKETLIPYQTIFDYINNHKELFE